MKHVADSIIELIARQANLQPDAVAVLAEDRDLTYRELLERASDVRCFLRNDGLKTEEPVAVLMHRNSDLIATLLGIWIAGGAYVPIDPGEPAQRVLQILERADCKRVVGDGSLWAAVVQAVSENSLDANSYTFKSVSDIPLSSAPFEYSPGTPRGSQLAYLLFTSGSTGEPKAVEVEHRSIANLLLRARDLLSVRSSDRYLAVATISFDISIAELFLPLIVGGSLVLRDRSILVDPHRLARLISDTNITIVQTGPSVWSVILDEVPEFPRVRVAVSTGEAIAPDIARKLVLYADEAWNLYGPTEATIWATAYRLSGARETETSWAGISAPIGRAIQGLTTLVVKPDSQTASKNGKGELLIGGIGIARGYRNQPRHTRERFITIDGIRFYRTGDLVSKNSAGVLQYLGRIDDQMKIRGIRVEPREIEEAIRQDKRVQQAATTWFETPTGTKAIVAAIVLETNTTCSATDLHVGLEDKLPSSLIPARFIFVPRIPIDKNGKVDRNAIRAAALTHSPNKCTNEASPPANGSSDTTTLVTKIWKRLLGVDDIHPESHFFAIGGDSLAAVTMTLELETALGFRLPLQLVLQTPVQADFVARIEAIKNDTFVENKSSFIFPLVEIPGSNPLFFCAADLTVAAYWTVPCSLYAITYWATGGETTRFDSIEEMASRYIDGIKERQPEGPYRLAGFSFGAIVAMEIAQQLTEKGETVELLFLLDPFKLFNSSLDRDSYQTALALDRKLHASAFIHRASLYLQRINPFRQRNGFIGWLAAFLAPINKIPGGPWLTYQLFHLIPRNHNPAAEVYLKRPRWKGFWFAAFKNLAAYSPKSYQGRTLALFTRKQGGHHVWSLLLGKESEIRFIKSNHTELFKPPSVETWMRLLTEELVRAARPDAHQECRKTTTLQ